MEPSPAPGRPACPNCHKPVTGHPEKCPHCGADIAKCLALLQGTRERLTRPDQVWGKTDKSAAPPSPAERSENRASVVKIILVVVGLALAGKYMVTGRLGFGKQLFPSALMTASAANTLKADPCLQKPRCLVAYVAPWCPACKQSIPTIQELTKRWKSSKNIGVKVIVGRADLAQMEEMAGEIGPNTFLDSKEEMFDALGKMSLIKAIPSWYVLDETDAILNYVPGTWQPTSAFIEKLELIKQDDYVAPTASLPGT